MSYWKVFLIQLLCAVICAENVTDNQIDLVNSTNKFAINLFKELANHEKSQNFLISPLSAYLALALTAEGAAGQTYEQAREVLGLPDQSVAQAVFQKFINESNSHENVELSIASRVYLRDTLKVKPEFELKAKEKFNSSIVKFNPDQVAETLSSINQWANESTHGKISDIVKADEVSDGLMLLMNAVYFKADWKIKFNESLTREALFNVTNENQKKVKFMNLQSNFFNGRLKRLKAQFIQIPYKNEEFKMTILLPNKASSLEKMMKNLNSSILKSINSFGSYSKVLLSLPKFKIDSSANLDDSLKKLGLKDMYDADHANFTTMVTPDEPFTITAVKQKAFINVNEEGSEAAAITTVFAMARSFYRPVKVFRVNRPAVFLISKKDVILFMGYFKDPSY